MEQVVLVIHLLIALALVGVILLQKTDGGALGGLGGLSGGGGTSFGGLFTARGGANFLTRTTSILAACFIGTSLLLAILASSGEEPSSVLDAIPTEVPAELPAVPTEPAIPQAPIAE